MTRTGSQLRDAAVGYASYGIPVLPLHYPLPRHGSLQPLPGGQQPAVARASCSCRDPGCGQVGKHPLGSLVPHGVKDATCNRARILAWWSRHPQANIGLATGHRFDVLDVDGPTGAQAIRTLAAEHGLSSSGPLVCTGGGGWHYYLARPASATSIRPAWSMWIGGAGVAMWSPRPAATPPATPTSGSPAGAWRCRPARSQQWCWSGWTTECRSGQLTRSRLRPSAMVRVVATRAATKQGPRPPTTRRKEPPWAVVQP